MNTTTERDSRIAGRLTRGLTMLLGVAGLTGVSGAAESPPNVVMIIADDLSYRDLGFMGNTLVRTPHIDQLAARSARFRNGYVPMSVCRPSLATLLTGLYPHQHGIHFNHPPPGLRAMRRLSAADYVRTRATTDYLIRNVATLPRILARHGYACLQTGKHWEGDYRLAGFTHGMTRGRPATRLAQITGTRTQENGEWVAHGNGDAGLVIGRETMQPIVDFLDQHATKRPCFIWYAPFLPHTPFDAPARFRAPYEARSLAEHLVPYYAEISRFDETVGALIEQLTSRNLMRRTLIIFVCDNGFRPDERTHSRQNARSKLSIYEDGIRTPLLIRWDGKTREADHRQLVHTIDIVPTVLAAAGLANERTQRMTGVNLMPAARGMASLPERPVFGAIYPNDAHALGAPSAHVRSRWVRSGRYKLVVPARSQPSVVASFFDLEADPLEATNLVASEQHASQIAELRRLLDAWWADGDDSRVTRNN